MSLENGQLDAVADRMRAGLLSPEGQSSESAPVTPLSFDLARGFGWAAWLTMFLLVLVPWSAVVYTLGAVYQMTREAWRQGRKDHTSGMKT